MKRGSTGKGAADKTRAMGLKIPAAVLAVAALLLAYSCTSRPAVDYAYANLDRIHGWSGDEDVTLLLDMTDTTGACELYITGEVATGRSTAEKKGLPLLILLTSPYGTQYRDSVTLPLRVLEDGRSGKTSHGVREIVWPYRKDIYNKIPGRWAITLSKGDKNEDYSNILGLGIHCKQNK
ncbi:MAG: hypothetical protein IJ383_06725 [Bacteroidales bacterium]|nr:hypothetical protein [Bacteroidales bacterium]